MKAAAALLTGLLMAAGSAQAGRLIDERTAALAAGAGGAGAAALGGATAAGVFDVLPEDKTVRDVLKRWSAANGWTFGDEHWTLPSDLPVQASAAALGTDYRSAVRTLLKSTELTNLPGQPCFYTNQVMRVIAANGVCQPGALDGQGGMAGSVDITPPFQETIGDRRARIEALNPVTQDGSGLGALFRNAEQ